MLGCERFAKETGQQLVDFYSIDKWGNTSDPSQREKGFKNSRKINIVSSKKDISAQAQTHIWNLRPGSTDHFPGKLSLCLGMPVMIRNNEATELCITKGQEGFVVGWQSVIGIEINWYGHNVNCIHRIDTCTILLTWYGHNVNCKETLSPSPGLVRFGINKYKQNIELQLSPIHYEWLIII